MEEVGALNNSHSAQRPPKPPQLRCSRCLHHAEMVICDRKYDVRYRCTSQVCQPTPFCKKSAGYQMSGEESENKPRGLLAVLLSPQRAAQRHAKGWRTRNGLLWRFLLCICSVDFFEAVWTSSVLRCLLYS